MPAGAPAKAEVEQVMEELVRQGASVLEKHGEFYPLGGYLSSDGRFALTAVHHGNEHPESAKVILRLRPRPVTTRVLVRVRALSR